MSEGTPFFRAGGTMEPGAPSYIERQADTDLFDALVAREFVFLLDSRQKGKSSMVARTIIRLREVGVSTVKLDLQRIGANVSAEQWYGGLLTAFGNDLGVTEALFAYWAQHQAVGPLARWLGALEHVVLPEISGPLVVFIDEVDFVRALPFPTDEFFAGIRDCYNRRAEGSGFDRLTFCLVGVATPGQLIRNPEVTPFNIGKRIDISDFTPEETDGYAPKLCAGGRDGLKLKRRVDYWLAGHPYLTQLLCSHIASDGTVRTHKDVDILVRRLFLTPEARQREANLSDVERRILEPDVPGLAIEERRTQVLELYGRVLHGRKVEVAEENPVVATLRLSGVGLEDKHALRLRNRLYGLVFDENWRRNSLPDAELRRQRGAARIALLRTAAVAGVFVLCVATVALNTNRLSSDRKKALDDLRSSSTELSRLSAAREAALTDLKARTQDLEFVSTARAKSLTDLDRTNKVLEGLTENQESTITQLSDKSKELEYRNYVGTMALLQTALADEDWARASALIKSIKSNPYRGWELNHVALRTGNNLSEVQLPSVRNEFENNPDGSLNLIRRDGIYCVTPTGINLKRKFRDPIYLPFGRQGNVRLGLRPDTGNFAIRDAETDAVLATYSVNVSAIDPKNKTALVYNEGKLRLANFDGSVAKELKENYPRSATNWSQQLLDGTILQGNQDGVVSHINYDQSIILSKSLTNKSAGFWVSDDGSKFICLEANKPESLVVRNVSDFAIVGKVPSPFKDTTYAFSHDNNQILLARDGAVNRYNIKDGSLLGSYFGHDSRITRLAFLPGDKYFASVDRKGVLKTWSLKSAAPIRVLGSQSQAVFGYAVSESERFSVYPLADHSIESMNLQTGKVVRTAAPLHFGNQGWQFTLDGDDLIYGMADGQVARASMATLRPLKTCKVFDAPITTLTSIMDEKRVLVGTDEEVGHLGAKYAILDVASLRVISRFKLSWGGQKVNYDITGGTFLSSKSDLFAVVGSTFYKGAFGDGGETTIVNLVSSTTGRTLREIRHRGQKTAAYMSNDGKKIYLSLFKDLETISSEIVVFDTLSSKKIGTLRAPDKAVITEFAMYGDFLVGRSSDDALYVWNVKSGGGYHRIYPGKPITGFDCSEKAKRIVTYDSSNRMKLWDLNTGEELITLYSGAAEGDKQPQRVPPIAEFSKDGKRIYQQSTDGILRVFDSEAGTKSGKH